MRRFLNIELGIYALYFGIITLNLIKSPFLFFDDIVYAFPAYSQDYFELYKGYFYNFGFFRPLALVYYFYIYELHRIWPLVSHLVPLIFLVLSAVMMQKVLVLQGLSKKQSLAASIVFLTIPAITETYSWLSANLSIFVIFIFLAQVYLIEKGFFKKDLLNLVTGFQLLSVFLYESTIFMPFALMFLFYKKGIERNKLKLLLYSLVPLAVYMISKEFVETQYKATPISIGQALSHWQAFFPDIKNLFSKYYLIFFWGREFSDGVKYLAGGLLSLGLGITLFVLLSHYFFKKQEKKIHFGKKYDLELQFWGLVLILSLIPLSWNDAYLPFRLLFLPFLIFFICLLFLINYLTAFKPLHKTFEFIDPFSKMIFIIAIFIFLAIQVSMVNQYINQYNFDKKIVTEIDQKLKILGFGPNYRSNLYIRNFPNNNIERPIYGDYIYGLVRNYWSAKALLDLNSGTFDKVAVEIPKTESSIEYFSAKFPKEEFLTFKPLTILKFTDNYTCAIGNCFVVEQIIK